MKKAVNELGTSKSCGLDNISVQSIKLSSDLILSHLSSFSSMCRQHSFIPEEVSDSYITPIVKNRNSDHSDASNYRPIAVSSIISKIFETVLKRRLESFITSTDNQFGYKSGLGTEHCIFTLKATIQHTLSNSAFVYCSFLDASKAFDKVNHRNQLENLKVNASKIGIVSESIVEAGWNDRFIRLFKQIDIDEDG